MYNDPEVASFYAGVFEDAWAGDVKRAEFASSDWSAKTFSTSSADTPKTQFNFSPHEDDETDRVLSVVADRITAEAGKKGQAIGSVLFAVMHLDKSASPVYAALKDGEGSVNTRWK